MFSIEGAISDLQSETKKQKAHQGWPEMPLILGRSGTQYVAMEIKLLNSHCGAHLAGIKHF